MAEKKTSTEAAVKNIQTKTRGSTLQRRKSGPRSRKDFFQSSTELGWIPYCYAIWLVVFSPASASKTTRNLNFNEDYFLAMTNASLWHSPGHSIHQLSMRSVPQYHYVLLLGVITPY
jgi:hypothetical protein